MNLLLQLLQRGLQPQLARGTAGEAPQEKQLKRLLQASRLLQVAASQPASAGRGPEKCESRGSQEMLLMPITVAVVVKQAAAVEMAVIAAAAAAAVRMMTCLVPPQPAAAALTVIGWTVTKRRAGRELATDAGHHRLPALTPAVQRQMSWRLALICSWLA
jgi:hypothetical protein